MLNSVCRHEQVPDAWRCGQQTLEDHSSPLAAEMMLQQHQMHHSASCGAFLQVPVWTLLQQDAPLVNAPLPDMGGTLWLTAVSGQEQPPGVVQSRSPTQ